MTTPSPLRPASIPWTELAGRLGRIGLHAASQALAGPSGAAVAQRIAAALGVEPTPSAIEAALAADPDAAVKLVHVELEMAKAAIGDTQAARPAVVAGKAHRARAGPRAPQGTRQEPPRYPDQRQRA